ncbi:MAG: VCBS repeat-containing protein [Sphingobacteriaceae bacterium]|nr:VCBS repeat-containing protein [Sphingobacteriaceae bacterium]
MANTKGTSVINNPQGGGAQSGLGEKFSPDLFTGTGNFSVPIAVPPGRNGFQPELSLGYSSGNGNGVFGMGWALGIPGVMRKTSKGIPVYEDKSDIFILSGAEDLVPVKIEKEILTGNIGYEKTFYKPRTEGLFARIIRHKKTNGEHYWEVRNKDGLISWYGTPGASTSLSNPETAVIANPENRNAIFSWALTKTEDTFGNVILYEYERELVTSTPSTSSGANPHIYDQIYLSKIKYAQYLAGSNTKYLCEVQFVYEERPDSHSSYKQGFEVRTTKRCAKIETYTNALSLIKTKTYHFNYHTKLPLNGASLLKSVSVEGHPSTGSGEESEFMPPLELTYSEFTPQKRDLKEISGPLPVNSIGEPGFELVDVTGNGLPDLLQLNGAARYWTNKGNGKFSPPKDLSIAPSFELVSTQKAEGAGIPGIAFIDANGDGRTDLLVLNGITAGYFPGAFQKVWDENGFKPFTQAPSFSLGDPEVQLIDLNGDGITDVLRNGSKFECFYNDPDKGFNKVRTADKNFADFSFADPRIRFADMTGDGLQDIVLISSGRVQYWPNMGYGRFGKKVNMKNAPVFPEQYDPKQILLSDLDGDGQADIAFVENNKTTLYVNQSGNAFSEGVRVANTPRIYNLNALRICDIMGTGQAGILWSFGPDAGTPGKMYFLDFTHGNKPYVLEEMNNNMGSITRVQYGSSVYHYLRDQALPQTRWKTQLPFPVQVVNKVEVFDLLSGGKLVTEYNYHNGYWDGVEREFRGFAHVDSKDTESFERFNTQSELNPVSVTPAGGLTSSFGISTEFYTPPTLTKSWFYVGPVGDGFSRWKEPDFSDEYWSGDVNVLKRPLEMLNLLNQLPRRARRDALRTLRGTLLRSELYGLDGSSFENIPYTVTENLMSLREEFNPTLLPDPLWNDKNYYWSGGGYVFFPFNVAQRTTQYERGSDPMHNLSFTKEYDAYGQARGQLSVGMPRGSNPLSGGNGNYLATFGISDFIYKDNGSGQYIVNRTKRNISYDASQSAIGKTVFKLRDDVFNSVVGLPVINCTLNFYDGSAFSGLPYGEIGNFGAQVRSETLIITDAIITQAYGATTPQCFETTPDWSTNYPAAFAGLLQNGDSRLGYKDRRSGFPNHIAGWYAESARLKYDFQAGPPFYGLVLESKDVFENLSTIEYDVYEVLPVNSKQWLNGTDYLETIAEYDYRVIQPFKITDVNENKSVFDFSPLGLLRATALIGKGTEGDYKSGSGGYYDRYAPSVVMEYDFFAFKNTGNPVWVKTISREKHYQQEINSPTITKVEYSDGFGRLLQTRVQAEDVIFGASTGSATSLGSSGLPAQQGQNANAVGIERGTGDPLNVVVSGWKIYNNKGMVVEQYEPFFDKGFEYELPSL